MSTDGAPKVSPRDTFTLLDLKLENIGPFDHAELTFYDREASEPQSPVTIITGENGAGKSIVIDAIRAMFGRYFVDLERPIWRSDQPFALEGRLCAEGGITPLAFERRGQGNNVFSSFVEFEKLPYDVASGSVPAPPWLVDFWRANLPADSFAIGTFETPRHAEYLVGSLQANHKNVDVTKALVYFDYLRDSRDPREKRAGEVLFETARRIVRLSLLDGELLDVQRSTFTPMFRQGGQTIPLANLSSGNAYMVQRMIGMLAKMHAVNTLRRDAPEATCDTPGLLLLDEAENHLHPRWQKRFLSDILDIFPNLQIIATTHSPFVTGSVPGARVYVCRYEREKRCSVVEDVTQDYADKPVEEILASAAFDETESFGTEITELLEKRRIAVQNRDAAERAKIEAKLYEKNPSYFGYLKLDEHLARLREAGE
jgi:hypothetical protein